MVPWLLAYKQLAFLVVRQNKSTFTNPTIDNGYNNMQCIEMHTGDENVSILVHF